MYFSHSGRQVLHQTADHCVVFSFCRQHHLAQFIKSKTVLWMSFKENINHFSDLFEHIIYMVSKHKHIYASLHLIFRASRVWPCQQRKQKPVRAVHVKGKTASRPKSQCRDLFEPAPNNVHRLSLDSYALCTWSPQHKDETHAGTDNEAKLCEGCDTPRMTSQHSCFFKGKWRNPWNPSVSAQTGFLMPHSWI